MSDLIASLERSGYVIDECIAREDDEYGPPRCGGRRWWDDVSIGCPGCQHCDPVQQDARPYGFGIERFEDPVLASVRAAIRLRAAAVFGAYSLCAGETSWRAWKPQHDALWAALSTQSKRRLRLAEIVWDRICDRALTHAEAVRLYRAWAERAVKVHFRDEK